MVHWKRSYGSFKDAIKRDDGLAVIAYLLSVSLKNYTYNI